MPRCPGCCAVAEHSSPEALGPIAADPPWRPGRADRRGLHGLRDPPAGLLGPGADPTPSWCPYVLEEAHGVADASPGR